MDFDENNDTEELEQEDAVEIYSRWAIFWFSIFFTTLAGGILLMLNLRAIGNKRAGNIVLIFSILYFIFSEFAFDQFLLRFKMDAYLLNGLSISCTVIGAGILSEYFFKKYFPDDDYYPKSMAQPIIIAVLIAIPVSLIIYNYAKV